MKDLNKLGLDPKHYKYHSSDEKSTTLEHKHGHKLVVAHNAVSPKMRTMLQALAKVPQQDETQANKEEAEAPYGKIIYKNEGGEINPKLEQSKKVPPHASINMVACEQPFAKGGKAEYSQQAQDVKHKDYENAKKEAKGRAEFERQIKPNIKGMTKGGSVSQFDFNPERDEAIRPYEGGLPCLNPHCKSHGKPHPNCRCYSGGEAFMAKGGYVETFCAEGKPHMPDCEYYKGGAVQKYAEGTDDGPVMMDKDKGVQQKAPTDPGIIHKMLDYLNSAGDTQLNKEMPKQAIQPAPQPQVQAPAAQGPMSQGSATPPAVQDNSDQGSQPAVQDQPPAAQASQPILRARPAQQPVQQPVQQAQPLNAQEQAKQDYMQAHAKEMGEDDAAYEHDLMNGHIKPKTYQSLFADKSTLGKVGTLFGMLLGGAGAGLLGQKNPVLEMMDNQIKNDLEAQGKSKDNALNFLRIAQQERMNTANIKHTNAETAQLAQSTAYARGLQSSFANLAFETDKMPDGPPKQAAKEQLARLYPVMKDKIVNANALAIAAGYNMHMMDNPQGMQGNDREAALQQKWHEAQMSGDPDLIRNAQYESERHFPGVDQSANQPIEAGDRDKIVNHNILDNKIKEIQDMAKKYNTGIWTKRTQEGRNLIAQAQQKAKELQIFYNKSADGLGLTPGREEWLSPQTGEDPTNWMEKLKGGQARLKEIGDSNLMRRNETYKKYGVKDPGQSQSQEKPQEAISKSGRPIIMRNGRWEYK